MNDVVTIILAVVGSVGAVTIQSIITRPKTLAEGRQADAAGEVAQSAEARQWVGEFRQAAAEAKDAAEAAELRSAAAEDRAHKAEVASEDAELRCDELERKFLKLATYARALQVWAVDQQGAPPTVPRDLIPPLAATP